MTLRCRPLAGRATLIAAGLALAAGLCAETGYDLWLRYALVTDSIESREVYVHYTMPLCLHH